MRRISCAILMATVCGCTETQVTRPVDVSQARDALAAPAPEPRYQVDKIFTSLGGTLSVGRSINNLGWVAGVSTRPQNQTREAVLWRDGEIVELGTLGGPNSSVQWPGQNDRGTIVGISQTAVDDTLGETWSCSAFLPFTGKTCVGFVWEAEDSVMKALPTLGGDNGFATGVNSRGQIVGWAETRVHDPTCNDPQVLQFRAVMWEPQKGRKSQLRPLAGDSASAATAINDRGEVVGISGQCDVAVGRFSALHSVLWKNGKPSELPNLGGEAWHTPMAINAKGDVVGFSNPPGATDGSFQVRAFLWTKKGGIQDLGRLKDDTTSQALGINSRLQVVGVSTSKAGINRAVLWQDGVLYDLNKLAQPGFADSLVSAQHINEAGTITGRLYEKSTGKTLPFVATPIDPR